MKARQDMVMMNNLLYYFSPGKRQDVFDHAARILAKKGTLLIMSPLHDSKHGKAFSTAFNSFMSAHENLHPLPSEKEIRAIGKLSGLKLVSVEPVLKEGGWYLLELQKKNNRDGSCFFNRSFLFINRCSDGEHPTIVSACIKKAN
ncbi:hypothetical protein [Sinobaca sp. H24]|uniref:hypothetical protein n=1 Tax=Sinobaca sp. H24 TaxID=2923376 RepID=UPI0020798FF4|nr:hypothetical protein [Sinobaca sp. H24]